MGLPLSSIKLIKDEKVYLFYGTRDDFQVSEYNSQSENHALSAETKSRS